MQIFQAREFLGKRVRMTSYIKSYDVDNWAGMWMRVDGPEGDSLSFDNMQDRPITGTTRWSKYEIVLDVPENSTNIAFGLLLAGKGKVWFDDINFSVVDLDVSTTGMNRSNNYSIKSHHLDFE